MKCVKTISLALLAFLAIQPVFGQLTLDSCQTAARLNYPLIKQHDLIQQTEQYSLENISKAYYPQLDINLIGGIVHGFPDMTGMGSSSTEAQLISVLQLNQVVWDGGINKSRKELTKLQSKADSVQVEVSMYALRERVNNLYFGILLLDKQTKQLNSLLEQFDRNMTRIKSAIEGGTAFQSDADELQVELLSTEQKKDNLLHARAAYINVLGAMTGIPMNQSDSLIKPIVPVQIAEGRRPELDQFSIQRNLIRSSDNLTKAQNMPKIGLMGFGTFITPGISFGPSDITNILVGGISVSWGIGGLYTSGNDRAINQLKLQQLDVQEETFNFMNDLTIRQNQGELNKYQDMIKKDRELIELKNRIKNAYEVKYQNGICTLSELMDKTNDLSRTEQELAKHEIQYLMSVYQQLNIQGN